MTKKSYSKKDRNILKFKDTIKVLKTFPLTILDTPYTVYICEDRPDNKNDYFTKIDADGFHFEAGRGIFVLESKKDTKVTGKYYMRLVLHHEIMHAFIHQDDRHDHWFNEEELCDWICYNHERIAKAWTEADKLAGIAEY